RPLAATLGLEQFLECDHLRIDRVLFAQGAEACLFKQAVFGFDIHVWLEEPDISLGDRWPLEASIDLRLPSLGRLFEYWDNGVVGPTPQAGAGTHDRAYRSEVGWPHKKANSGWSEGYLC